MDDTNIYITMKVSQQTEVDAVEEMAINSIEDMRNNKWRKGGYNYDNRTLEGVSNRAVIPNMY